MSQVNFLPSAPVPTGTLQSSAAASDAASVTINQIPRKWSGNFKIDLNQSDVWIWLAAALKTQ